MTEEKKKKAVPKAKAPKPKEAEVKAEAPKAEEKARTEHAHKPEAKAHEHAAGHPAHKAEAHAPKAEAPKHAEAAPKAEAPAKKKRAAPKKKPGKRVFVARGKRKESVARATIHEGSGVVRINRISLNALNNAYMKEIIREPLRYMGPEANGVDISVEVCGGGAMGQAQAARTAIANALVAYFDTMNLEEKFVSIDRTLVVEDTRRVETKKFRGPKARARFQKSYR